MDMKEFKFSSRTGTIVQGKYHNFPVKAKAKEGPTLDIVLIHAFPFDSDMYLANFEDEEFFDKLNDLAIRRGEIRVFIPDLPGFGNSEPFKSRPQNLIPYCEVIQNLMLEFDIEHLILGGCSMGGYITLEFANQFPQNLEGMILMDTKPSADTDQARQNRLDTIKQLEEILKETVRPRDDKLTIAEIFSEYAEIQKFIEGLYTKVVSKKQLESESEKGTKIKALMKDQTVKGIIHALSGMAGRVDNTSTLKQFEGETLILVGDDDRITPIEIARKMNKTAQDSTLHIIPDAGHLSNWENVSEFNRYLFDWLQSIIKDTNL